MNQSETLIAFMLEHPEGVTTADFVKHPVLCAEFRARISELRGTKGARFTVPAPEKIRKGLFKYRLIEIGKLPLVGVGI